MPAGRAPDASTSASHGSRALAPAVEVADAQRARRRVDRRHLVADVDGDAVARELLRRAHDERAVVRDDAADVVGQPARGVRAEAAALEHDHVEVGLEALRAPRGAHPGGDAADDDERARAHVQQGQAAWWPDHAKAPLELALVELRAAHAEPVDRAHDRELLGARRRDRAQVAGHVELEARGGVRPRRASTSGKQLAQAHPPVGEVEHAELGDERRRAAAGQPQLRARAERRAVPDVRDEVARLDERPARAVARRPQRELADRRRQVAAARRRRRA